jgi:hypothetical protein
MILSLLAPFGVIGIAAGLFGLYLARLLLVDGSADDAAATGNNARLLLALGSTLLAVAMFWTG